jgi:hypothetical protein
VIRATVEPNAVSPAAVEFVLSSGLSWYKSINVPDGGGSSWEIYTGFFLPVSRTSDRVALWAGQVHNGQVLTFSKAKFLGAHWPIYTLGNLDFLSPGSRVTFTWTRD